MKRLGWILVGVLCLGCTDTIRTPKGVYGHEQMQNILWDMLLADRYATLYLQKDSLRRDIKNETFALYEQVFALHHTNREAFLKSFRYYLGRPDLTQVMFDTLAIRAGKTREELFRKFQ